MIFMVSECQPTNDMNISIIKFFGCPVFSNRENNCNTNTSKSILG